MHVNTVFRLYVCRSYTIGLIHAAMQECGGDENNEFVVSYI
jgi:hypothetical protein